MKKHALKAAFIIPICLSLLISGCAGGGFDDMRLGTFTLDSSDEAYLDTIRQNPVRLAYSFEIVAAQTRDGEIFGMYKPLLELLESEFGLTVELVKMDWDEASAALDAGKIDLYGPIALTGERLQKYYGSMPFYSSCVQIISRVAQPVSSPGGLKGKSIGALSDSAISGTMESYIAPNGRIVYYPSVGEMLDDLEKGEIACAAVTGSIEIELLLRPELVNEFIMGNIFADQGLIGAETDMLPLLNLIDRYISSGSGFEEKVLAARRDAMVAFERERFAGDVAYLSENVKSATVFSSGSLYPLCYLERGVYKGMQIEINELFTDLTGVPIEMDFGSRFPNGLYSSIDMIKSGKCMASGATYFDPAFDADPSLEYSIPIWADTIRTYTYREAGGDARRLLVGSTPHDARYVDWPVFVDNPPLMYDSRRTALTALKSRKVDVVFLSEMCFNYMCLIERDYSLREAGLVTAEADMHMIYGRHNPQYNRMYDEAIRVYRTLYPGKVTEWKIEANKYKIDSLRMRKIQQNMIFVVGFLFLISFALLYYLIKKYTTYDIQISRLIRTQQTFDLAWGDLKTEVLISKGNLSFLREWGLELDDKSKYTMDEISEAFGVDLAEDYKKDIDKIKRDDLPFVVTDRMVISPKDNMPRHYRRFLHKLSDHEFMSCLQDITSDVLRERELTRIAATDYLSKLLTRRAMNDRMLKKCAELKRTGEQAFIIMADIDDFKEVNDNFGHDVGDKVLVSISSIIRSTEGCENSTSRWGGEEFLIMLECDSIATASERVLSIIERVSRTVISTNGGRCVSVTISAGLTRLDPSQDYVFSVTRADRALYRAKRAGKNCLRVIE